MSNFAGKQASSEDTQAPRGGAMGPQAGKLSLVQQAYAAVAQAKADASDGVKADGEHAQPAAATGGGKPLPPELRAQMEKALDADFSEVRIHEGGEASAIGAKAFTRRHDIFFAPGQYDPTSEPGRELIGHELTHVVQQAQGRVQATTQAKGLAVNTDDGLEHEADALGARAARGEHAPVAGGGGGAGGPVVQRKGDVPLKPQADQAVVGAGPAAAPRDPRIAALIAEMEDYDHHPDGRPAQQLAVLDLMIATATAIISDQPKPSGFAGLKSLISKPKPSLADALRAILVAERAIVEQQKLRLDRHTATDDAPYQQMTEEGMLWNHPDYADGVKEGGPQGKRYFENQSSENLESMHAEASAGGEAAPRTEAWFAEFVSRASAALSTAVVNHYTTSARARAMKDGGGMKSKMKLEKENASFKHNTSAYDDLGLANSGFVFFFIEAPDAAMRPTRFAEGDDGATPARISIPIQESGLLASGWVMLSDFAQREYPDISTNAASDRHTSWLPTRADEQKKKPENAGMTHPVRKFVPGLGDFNDADMEHLMNPALSSEKRQAYTAVTPQARGDAQSKQVYTGPAGEHQVPDKMRNNMLVGGDIIPGIAMRAALEVSRMAKVNPTLAETFKTLDGAALMKFMLKDLFRPQAMIPNLVKITDENIQA
jgi:hypothetical protein